MLPNLEKKPWAGLIKSRLATTVVDVTSYAIDHQKHVITC